MPCPIPYLAFDGRCADARRFHERALHGKLELLLRNADSPMALQPMFWAATSGMLTDKFGTAWIVNGDLQAVYAPSRVAG
jgi:uncharacterized glyoxalase superfamily protein PhnB